MKKSFAKLLLLTACAVALLSAFAVAQDRDHRDDRRGDHPAYLRAMSDLREAIRLMQVDSPDPRLNGDLGKAIDEASKAIIVIKEAATEDGKNINENRPPDPQSRGDRLSRAVDMLDKAYRDIDTPEGNDYTRDLKHRALDHVRAAQVAARQAWHETH